MSDNGESPWYFRQRQALFGAVYGLGFFFGFLGAGVIRHDFTSTYALLGSALPVVGAHAWLGIAVAITAFGWLWRAWGSSYLSGEIVWSEDLRAGGLRTGGPFRLTRNPLYFGNLFVALGFGMIGPPETTALVVLGNWIFDLILIRAEEPLLAKSYGAAYSTYRANVPALFPRLTPWRGGEESARPSLAEGLRSEVMMGGFVVAIAIGYFTQRPLSWPVWTVFVVAIVVNEFVKRKAARHET
jgi:protein-S-isoprenylcysteine O-methyltransferase Ste14